MLKNMLRQAVIAHDYEVATARNRAAERKAVVKMIHDIISPELTTILALRPKHGKAATIAALDDRENANIIRDSGVRLYLGYNGSACVRVEIDVFGDRGDASFLGWRRVAALQAEVPADTDDDPEVGCAVADREPRPSAGVDVDVLELLHGEARLGHPLERRVASAEDRALVVRAERRIDARRAEELAAHAQLALAHRHEKAERPA